MEKILYPVQIARMKLLLVLQFFKRLLTDLPKIGGAELFTDMVVNNAIPVYAELVGRLDRSVMQMRKNDDTAKVSRTDRKRDKKVSAFGAALKVLSFSHEEEILDAYNSILSLFNSFGGVKMKGFNYELQTSAMDNFVADCEDRAKKYNAYIKLLKLEDALKELKDSNTEFKGLFDGRIHEETIKEVFDVKQIRNETTAYYNAIVNYTEAMMILQPEAKQYAKMMDSFNEARKYYSDRQAISDGLSEAQKAKTEALELEESTANTN